MPCYKTPCIWLGHDKSEESKTPKYLKVGTTSRMVPLTERGMGGRQGHFFLEISMVLHLLVLNVIVFKVDQVLNASMSA